MNIWRTSARTCREAVGNEGEQQTKGGEKKAVRSVRRNAPDLFRFASRSLPLSRFSPPECPLSLASLARPGTPAGGAVGARRRKRRLAALV